jgi:hypothetical protein
MGYSKNPSSIEKVEKFLTLMVNANESLEWETPNPDKLAYYIREGIFASGALYKREPESDRLKEFSDLKSKFIIKIKGSLVLAELRSETPLAVMGVKRLRSVYLPNVATLTEIVGAVAKCIIEESKEQIRIPNSDILEGEFRKLEAYLKSKKLEIEVSGNELVISKSVN